MKYTKEQISENLWHAAKHPRVRNIRELKKLIADLPDDLRVRFNYGEPAVAAVYNVGAKDAFFTLAEMED